MQVKWQLTFSPHDQANQISQQFEMFPQSLISQMMTSNKLKRQIAAGCKDNLIKLKELIEVGDGFLPQK